MSKPGVEFGAPVRCMDGRWIIFTFALAMANSAETTLPASFSRSLSGGIHHLHRGGHRPLLLRGGGGGEGSTSKRLVIPTDTSDLEEAMQEWEEKGEKDGSVWFLKGEHDIGLAEFDCKAVRFDRPALETISIAGEEGAILKGHWSFVCGVGSVKGVNLHEVYKLADDGFYFDELGDNCLTVEGRASWVFVDCEVQCSGTALRACEEAHVTWERVTTGGSPISIPPPTNFSVMQLPRFLEKATVQMGLRDAVTGEPTIKDTSMPKFGVTAWGQATVIVSDSKILNMSYNGVCASGNSSITMQGTLMAGSGMAGIYLEGWPHVTVEGCVFDGNYCALSVWGGYTQERWVKTATEDYEEEDLISVPATCNLTLRDCTFRGIVWGGDSRPRYFEESGNIYEDDVDMEEKTGDDKPGWLPYVHVKEGEKIQFWDMHTPISIPKWAPKGTAGGDGQNHWVPSLPSGDEVQNLKDDDFDDDDEFEISESSSDVFANK